MNRKLTSGSVPVLDSESRHWGMAGLCKLLCRAVLLMTRLARRARVSSSAIRSRTRNAYIFPFPVRILSQSGIGTSLDLIVQYRDLVLSFISTNRAELIICVS